MTAHYDTYDYPAYWEGRDYEHKSEVLAVRTLLESIPKIKNILEIGAGYGRLFPAYSFRAKKIILTDPSAKLLSLARKTLGERQNLFFVQSTIENLPTKIKKGSVDLIILVRVLHHLPDIAPAFKIINRLLKDGGFLILEFPNKSHLKAVFSELAKGNLTFLLDIFPKDIRCRKHIKAKTLPFFNYHPDDIIYELKQNNLEPITRLSVSNIRLPFLKRIVSLETLLWLEEKLQKPLSWLNFGPSLFILARKKG